MKKWKSGGGIYEIVWTPLYGPTYAWWGILGKEAKKEGEETEREKREIIIYGNNGWKLSNLWEQHGHSRSQAHNFLNNISHRRLYEDTL